MNKEKLTNHIRDMELKQSVKKVLDLCEQTIRSHRMRHSKFLTPNVLAALSGILPQLSEINYTMTSLNEEAERRILYVYPSYEEFENQDFVLSIVKAKPVYPEQSLSHRDYLGSILSLGIERENIGDIVFDEEQNAYIIVIKPMDEFLLSNFNKVRHTKILLSIVDEIPKIERKYERKIINIASFRLDSIVAGLLNLSREKSQRLIQSGDVRVDFVEEKNNSKMIAAPSVLSIRGFGKFKIGEFISETKKNRLRLEVFKFGN